MSRAQIGDHHEEHAPIVNNCAGFDGWQKAHQRAEQYRQDKE